ncbi:MAG: hypothetical protein MZW92_54330 [Comamonadaceae bacterium]|nr:hypothetical protein [Comamonadaceae bacterium]
MPLALVINELGTNAHEVPRQPRAADPRARAAAAATAWRSASSSRASSSRASTWRRSPPACPGLGLVKALLPRRGAKLAVEQQGAQVVTAARTDRAGDPRGDRLRREAPRAADRHYTPAP